MYKQQINETAAFLAEKLADFRPECGIILGTGLGALVNEIDILHTFDYEDIPNFPVSTVEFHKGKLIFGTIGGKNIVCMQGRFHYYEGYTMQEVT
ncbi:MAG: purine-nucleoside phosphorylase, partial [Spirosomataceae bacterium]